MKYFARAERFTFERPRGTLKLDSRSIGKLASKARRRSQQSQSTPGGKATQSTRMAPGFYNALYSHTMELVMKEVMCIHSTPTESQFNRDSGYELADYWITLNQKLNGGALVEAPSASDGRTHSITQLYPLGRNRPCPASFCYR